MTDDCVFCRIVKKEIPSDIIYEDKSVIVFKNIKPLAPIHLLAIPKKHIKSIEQLKGKDKDLLASLLIAIQKSAKKEHLSKDGYKLAVNVGEGGGQEIFHLHIHLLGGWKNKKNRDIPGMP
jgi:histidine triad (HIT) family protein